MSKHVTPLANEEAISRLARDPDPDYAQGIIDLIQAGHATAGVDDAGKLHLRVTPAGERAAAELIRRLGTTNA